MYSIYCGTNFEREIDAQIKSEKREAKAEYDRQCTIDESRKIYVAQGVYSYMPPPSYAKRVGIDGGSERMTIEEKRLSLYNENLELNNEKLKLEIKILNMQLVKEK